jgi:assimilatory nitrate reductase catalytic subunit
VPASFWEHVRGEGAIERVSESCDVPSARLNELFALFADTPRSLTMFSQGTNQSVQGTDNANAIINLHLATGRIGSPGAGPFSITGQPNAMGGREVGGLASTLAAHMGFSAVEVERVGRFWSAPSMAVGLGLKAVEMFEAIHKGQIKALWVMGTNPAVSLPNATRVREALATCPFVVVSDVMADTDTGRFAHVRLPALAWGEKNGTVTNSERLISRQRPFFEAPGEARPDWWIITDVAQRMGFDDAFSFDSAAAIFTEHARLTAYENGGARKLDLRDWVGVSYDAMEPRAWGSTRPFADGRYPTPSGRARLVTVAQRPLAQDASLPMTVNTGRYRDQWHTMTRTGLSARLAQHRREPFVEIHPLDAAEAEVAEGDLVRVATAQGASVFKASLNDAQRRGDLFVPIHWTDVTSSGGRTGFLPSPKVDPYSGQPGFKATPASITRVEPAWRGFLVTRDAIDAPACLWWTRVRVSGGWLYELAGIRDAAMEMASTVPDGQRIEAIDARRGSARIAVIGDDGRLRFALYASSHGSLPAREWIASELESQEASAPMALLAGRPAIPPVDRGAIICACFDVGVKTILSAIADQRLTTVEAIGTALGAGTNCGSCRPALAGFLRPAEEAVHAAE